MESTFTNSKEITLGVWYIRKVAWEWETKERGKVCHYYYEEV